MADTVNQCERDVEMARSKLAQDLATLRSPATFSSFTSTVKHEVLDTKDAVVAQAKDAVQSRVADFVEDLKAKAAANPAAALTIGAGIAWQFIRNPPIATALIGAGFTACGGPMRFMGTATITTIICNAEGAVEGAGCRSRLQRHGCCLRCRKDGLREDGRGS